MYDERRKASPDPEVKKFIEKARSMSGVAIDPKVLSFFLTGYSKLCCTGVFPLTVLGAGIKFNTKPQMIEIRNSRV